MIKRLTIKMIRGAIREEEWFPTKIIESLTLDKGQDVFYLRPKWMFRETIKKDLRAAGLKFEECSDNGLVIKIDPYIDIEIEE